MLGRLPTEPYSPSRGLWKRFLGAAVLIIVLTAGATATAGLLQVNNIVANISQSAPIKDVAKEITASEAGAAQTFLIIGSDKRAKSQALQDRLSPPHSDTLMLMRMDPAAGQTSVLSIPRDLQTELYVHGQPNSLQKINAAYSIGGVPATLETIKHVFGPGLQVNHIVDVNFAGFRKVIDAIGCVYVYVDRHYFNQNTGLISNNFSSINIQPGYQKLCDQTALDYARYRHTDSDFVRVARQQDFIRQAKEQVGVQGLLDHADAIEKAFGRAVQTDSGLHHTSEILRLLKLAAFSLGRPVRQVHFQSTAGPSFVTATPYDIQRTLHDFLFPPRTPKTATGPSASASASAGASHGRGRGRSHGPAVPGVTGLISTPRSALDAATTAAVGSQLRVYVPGLRAITAASADTDRRYTIRDEQNHPHHAYVISISRGLVGQFYGVEGMDWVNPPILTHPSETRTIAGRKFDLFFDGSHLRIVAWRTPHAVYWVNNTITTDLTNGQMLAIAASLRPVG